MTSKQYLKLKGELQVTLMQFKRKALDDKVNVLGEDYKNLETKIIQAFFKQRGFSVQEYLGYKETIRQKKIEKEAKASEKMEGVGKEIATIKEDSDKKGKEITKKLSKKDQEIFDIKKSMKDLTQDTFEMLNENTHRVDTLLDVSKEDFMFLNDKIKDLEAKLEDAKKEVKKEVKKKIDKPKKEEPKKELLTKEELKKIKEIIKDDPQYVGKLANLIGKRGMIPDEGYNDSYFNKYATKVYVDDFVGATFSGALSGVTTLTTQNHYPVTDDTYYLGKNDDDTPFAWKGVILKDTTDGKYYRIEVVNGVVTATDLTD